MSRTHSQLLPKQVSAKKRKTNFCRFFSKSLAMTPVLVAVFGRFPGEKNNLPKKKGLKPTHTRWTNFQKSKTHSQLLTKKIKKCQNTSAKKKHCRKFVKIPHNDPCLWPFLDGLQACLTVWTNFSRIIFFAILLWNFFCE